MINIRGLFALILVIAVMFAPSSCQKSATIVEENIFYRSWDTPFGAPPFDKITSADYLPALRRAMGEQLESIALINSSSLRAGFESVILPYDQSGAKLADIYNLYTMCQAAGVEGMADISGEVLTLMAAHRDSLLHNKPLFEKIRQVYDLRKRLGLDDEQRRLVERYYDEFRRGGASLVGEDSVRFEAINGEIAALMARFSTNLASEERDLYIAMSANDVESLPATVRNAARAEARSRGLSNKWVFTTQTSSWLPFLTHSKRRDLREQLYKLYLNRASGGEWDNREVVRQIALLRLERAQILGYKSHAEYVISNQMASSPEAVYSLLEELYPMALDGAEREMAELEKMLDKDHSGAKFEAWDWYYYMDKYRRREYNIDSELVKSYFPLESVRGGMFMLANRLYGLTFRPVVMPQYAEGGVAYEVFDIDEKHLGLLYFDLFVRPGKGQGAWCGFLREQRYEDGERLAPIVSITANIAAAQGSASQLLSAAEVRTLFHEFGHALHFLLQDVPYRGLADVEGDFVEFPSQLMENWAFEPAFMGRYAIHNRTGSIIPTRLAADISRAERVKSSIESVEYLSAALSDLDLHSISSPEELDSVDVLAFESKRLRDERALPAAIEPRYRYTYFRHLFDYDYSAGYYFYIWAAVFDKDTYAKFTASGDIFNRDLASRLRSEILERGGTKSGVELYRSFSGEDADRKYMYSSRGFEAKESSQKDRRENKIDTTYMDKKNNPLLQSWAGGYSEPPFEKIELKHYEPAFEVAIAESRSEVEAIAESREKATFENTIVALERQGALLERVAGVFYPLHSALTSDEMEQISLRVQPKLTALSNDISLNEKLFARVKRVYDNPPAGLSSEDKMLLEECYKGFTRSGANLSDEDKELYRSYTEELGKLSIEFGQNALAATNDFSINITDSLQVAELPEMVREALAEEAASRSEQGWTVTLKAPSYIPFLTYSTNREIKERLWRAYSSRALGGKWDNSAVIKRMVELRTYIALLLGYGSYAEYALENRMAISAESVEKFLHELLSATKEYAVKDYQAVVAFAVKSGFEGEFMPWDFAYYAEKLKDDSYSISDEITKPYFELSRVREGVFSLATKLYGLKFIELESVDRYHPDVQVFEVRDEDESLLSLLYLDFFPRDSKRGGAWMTEFRNSWVDGEEEIRPLVSLVMNFTKPTESTPSLLTFSEVETLLHEFGHALHGMLAKGRYSSLNGTNVYRDFVELPSQLMENWASEGEFLEMWAEHYQSGEKIPADLIEKIVKAKNYNAAYANVRQLQFGLLDMAWHTHMGQIKESVESFERKATAETQILPLVDGMAMSPTFSHIFNGGYSAGYYSYKWAEVLEADAFALFKERGIFNREVATSFRRNILERGGQGHPMDLYVRYRSHAPQTQALIDKILDKH
ncbi:MAG: M3 family metallopeptidase [Rikenellaceae bacterium]